MVAHQQFEHDEHRQNRVRPRGHGFLAPTDENKQGGDREECSVSKNIADVRILNEASKERLKVKKTGGVRFVHTREVCVSSRLHGELEICREMSQVSER